MDLQHRHLQPVRSLHRYAAVAALTAGALLVPAAARSQVSVEASPLRIDLTAGPGSSTTQAVSLTNAGTESVRIRATTTDWTLSRDGTPQFEGTPPDGPFSATPWIRVAPPELVIEPGVTALVRISLTVPESVTPAGYRSGVLFALSPAAISPIEAQRGVSFRGRIATLLYVDIGNLPPQLELTDLEVRSVGAQTLLVATVKNPSKRTVRTRGTVTITNPTITVRSLQVPDVPVLPESERLIAVPIVDGTPDQTLPSGGYKAEVRIDAGQPTLIVGETSFDVPATR